MSGGHYDYKYFQIELLADEIQNELEVDFISKGCGFNNEDFDRLGDCTPNQRELVKLIVQNLVLDLKDCAKKAKELEWYLSGDTGIETFLNRINNK